MDLADAHCAAVNYLFKNKPIVLNLNIGTGKETSVLELVNTFIGGTNIIFLMFLLIKEKEMLHQSLQIIN